MRKTPHLLRFVLFAALLTAMALRLFWNEESRPVSSSQPQSGSIPGPTPLPPVSTQQFHSSTKQPSVVTDAKITGFDDWLRAYQAASATEKAALVASGVQLARTRRTALAEIIRTAPEQALAAALPVAVRNKLPLEIIPFVEERVSGKGDFATLAATPVRGQRIAKPVFLAAHVNGREYRAFTYGTRKRVRNLAGVGIHGIAIDGELAVSESPIRILERGETAAGKPVERICPNAAAIPIPSPDAPLNATRPVAFDTGDRIQICCTTAHIAQTEAALRAGEAIAADSGLGSSGVSGRPTQAWSHGTKKVLIIRVDFSDLTGTPLHPNGSVPITEDYAVNLFNDANGIRDFYVANSYGKTTLAVAATVAGDSPDVTGVLRMPTTAASYATTGNNSQLHTDARNLAAAAGFTLASYDRIGVVFSNLGGIGGSKITYGGLGNINGKNFWVNGYYDFRVVAHEIGHNYGLYHSNFWDVSDGNPVSAAGTSVEYGDDFCLMGDGDFFENHFSHWNKSILQWIPDSAVTTISTGGTYRVFKFDAQGASTANPLALKIVRNGTLDYWIGHRRATANAALDNGAYVLWGYNDNSESNLLDFNTPGTNTADAPLQVGQSFNDAAAGITLTTLARGGTGNDEWIDVQVAFQPRIQFSAAQFVANEQGGSAVVTLTRTNNGTGSVSVNYATTAGTATTPADFTNTSGSVSWANGDLANKTITIPLAADALAEGTENFTLTLSGISGGVIAGSTSATVTIADPGARDPQFAADFINSTIEKVLVLPDGKILAAGWFSVIQDSGFVTFNRGGIARFNEDGSVDTDFAVDGAVTGGGSPRVLDFARQPDGKLIIGGSFTTVNGVARANIARLNADGSLDTGFNPGAGANDIVNAVLALPDGKIIVGGYFTTFDGQAKRMLVRLNANGSVDATFTPPVFGTGTGWRVESLAAQTDGKIIVGGSFYFSGSPAKAGICRVTTAGALDGTFNGVTHGAHLAGNTGQIRSVEKIAVLNDGSLLISGNFTAFNNTARGGIAKLTSTGALDAGFAPTSNGRIAALRVQPDGKILVGGEFTTLNGAAVSRFGRLTSAGANDTVFLAAGGHGDSVEDFAFAPDGRVVFGGNFASFQGSADDGPLWRFYAGLASLPGTVQLSAEAQSGVEGTTLNITATRTGGTLGAINVGYSTVVGTATGADFTATTGSLSWSNGDSAAKTISIPIAADALADNGETFTVNLGEGLVGTAILSSAQQSTVTIYTAFGAWQASNFTSVELANAAISGDFADPDGDGRDNLTEFALGLAPRIPDAGSSPAAGVANVSATNYLTLTFRRRVPALDLTYTVQNNDLLGTSWTSSTTIVGTPASNGDGTETVTFRDDTPVSGTSQRYMRLQIQRAP